MTSRNNAEGQPSGTALNAGNSGGGSGTALSVVSNGASNSSAFNSAAAMHGANGYRVTKGGTAASVYELRDGSGSTDFATRIYYNLTGLPSVLGASMGVQLRTIADAQQGGWRLTAAGLLTLYNSGGTTLATGTVPISTGTYTRYESQHSGINGSSGVWAVQAYVSDSLTPIDSITASSVVTTGLIDRARAGNSGASAITDFDWDGFHITAGSSLPIGIEYPDMPAQFVRHRIIVSPPRRPLSVPASPALWDAPDWSPPPVRVLRRAPAVARRPRTSTPVPTQAAVTASTWKPASARSRRAALPGRRAKLTAPAPQQVIVAAPAKAPSVVGGRRVGRKLRRQLVVSPPPVQLIVPPAYPVRPVRRRTLPVLIRRGIRRFLPTPTSTAPTVTPKAPRMAPGTRSSAGAAPGTHGSAAASPGTRSGPTIEGGA